MKELIVQAAKKNTDIGSANFSELHLVKLESIKDLDSVKDRMCEDAKESL